MSARDGPAPPVREVERRACAARSTWASSRPVCESELRSKMDQRKRQGKETKTISEEVIGFPVARANVLSVSAVNLRNHLQGMFPKALSKPVRFPKTSVTSHFSFLKLVSLDSSIPPPPPFLNSRLFTHRLAFGKGTHLEEYARRSCDFSVLISLRLQQYLAVALTYLVAYIK